MLLRTLLASLCPFCATILGRLTGAHAALGYSSWGTYYEAEFGGKKSHGYELLNAARVQELVSHSAIAESQPATEAVARELVPVLRDDPEQVEEVWAEAVEEHGTDPFRRFGGSYEPRRGDPREGPPGHRGPRARRRRGCRRLSDSGTAASLRASC